jgi:hypothetical protein
VGIAVAINLGKLSGSRKYNSEEHPMELDELIKQLSSSLESDQKQLFGKIIAELEQRVQSILREQTGAASDAYALLDQLKDY